MKLDDRKLAGLLVLLGASQFIVGMVVAECVYPGYSVVTVKTKVTEFLSKYRGKLIFTSRKGVGVWERRYMNSYGVMYLFFSVYVLKGKDGCAAVQSGRALLLKVEFSLLHKTELLGHTSLR